ncbi:MAG: hypothetical protein M1150_01230 [Patescibacteria group bacterium]|nr:hypothetical protein [Patescibacteria group bacterium]
MLNSFYRKDGEITVVKGKKRKRKEDKRTAIRKGSDVEETGPRRTEFDGVCEEVRSALTAGISNGKKVSGLREAIEVVAAFRGKVPKSVENTIVLNGLWYEFVRLGEVLETQQSKEDGPSGVPESHGEMSFPSAEVIPKKDSEGEIQVSKKGKGEKVSPRVDQLFFEECLVACTAVQKGVYNRETVTGPRDAVLKVAARYGKNFRQVYDAYLENGWTRVTRLQLKELETKWAEEGEKEDATFDEYLAAEAAASFAEENSRMSKNSESSQKPPVPELATLISRNGSSTKAESSKPRKRKEVPDEVCRELAKVISTGYFEGKKVVGKMMAVGLVAKKHGLNKHTLYMKFHQQESIWLSTSEALKETVVVSEETAETSDAPGTATDTVSKVNRYLDCEEVHALVTSSQKLSVAAAIREVARRYPLKTNSLTTKYYQWLKKKGVTTQIKEEVVTSELLTNQGVVPEEEEAKNLCLQIQQALLRGKSLKVAIEEVAKKNLLELAYLEDLHQTRLLQAVRRVRELSKGKSLDKAIESVSQKTGFSYNQLMSADRDGIPSLQDQKVLPELEEEEVPSMGIRTDRDQVDGINDSVERALPPEEIETQALVPEDFRSPSETDSSPATLDLPLQWRGALAEVVSVIHGNEIRKSARRLRIETLELQLMAERIGLEQDIAEGDELAGVFEEVQAIEARIRGVAEKMGRLTGRRSV